MSKYRAIKTTIDGFKFDSKLEAYTYLELKRLHECGAIASISLQYPFELHSRSGKVICKYVADFVCKLPTGKVIVVESKGVATPVWRLKKKLFQADYPDTKLIEVKGIHQFPLIVR